MQPPKQSSDWRTILLLIFSIGGILVMLMGAITTQVMGFFPDPQSSVETSPLVRALVTSLMVTTALMLLPAGWLSLQRLRHQEIRPFQFPKFRPWMWVLYVLIWLLSLVLATLLFDAPSAGWYVPLFHFLSIALPVFAYVYILTGRISIGSNQRVWGVFSAGLLISPALSIVAEVALVLFSLVIVGIIIGFNPENLGTFQRTIERIQAATDLDSLMFVIQPVARNPLTLVVGLVLLSGFVPFIEETFKSVGVWLVFDKLETSAQGFALGAVSGAAFAFLESLGASISPDPAWGATLFMRAVSSMMHILATGFVGWGIARARIEKKYLGMIGFYLLAMTIHSLWNAGAVLSVIGGMRLATSFENIDIFGGMIMVAGVGTLLFMMAAMPGAMIFLNRKLGMASGRSEPVVDQEQR
jgi:uncharacterized membrane protein YidH (DUF202 family)